MRNTGRLYGCLFVLVILIAIVGGYVVATSLTSASIRLPNPLSRLEQATPTLGSVEARLVTASPAAPSDPSVAETPGNDATPTVWAPPTIAAPTLAWEVTATTAAGASAGPSPIAGSPTASATPTITATPTPSRWLFMPQGQAIVRPERECYVGAVFGYVYDEAGKGVTGVEVRVSDPWNHVFTAVTKAPPEAGYYDVIQGTGPVTWYVVMVDAQGNQVSPVVTVEHKEGAPGCWYQVDFRRTRAR